MGYSLGIRTRTPVLQKKMLEFMKIHYRTWPAVLGKPDSDAYVSDPTDDLSYHHGSNVLGVDYQSGLGGWERVHAYAIVRWMALKVGAKRTTFSELDLPKMSKPVPFMLYDGDEAWPILEVETPNQFSHLPKKLQPWAFTPLGLYYQDTAYIKMDVVIDLADDFKAMMAEVQDKLGTIPTDGVAAREDWLERRHRLMLPHCEKKLRVEIKTLKAEMQRLENLWNNT